jgi:hypothetical protein
MKRSQIVLIVIAVLVIGALAFLGFRRSEVKKPINKVVNVTETQLPEKFPGGVPIEPGAKIVKNYNSISPDGRVQASRVFESSKSVGDNYDFYKEFLSRPKNGWRIILENGADPNNKALFARNAEGVLNVHITPGKQAGTAIVDLSFLASRPK